jgi:glycosyltransferase involved in cell wall biosynthesis
VRLAYLCNVYPAVSHSFVRREIEGVEAAGHEVHRFSHRAPQSGLRDEADLREAAVTQSVLRQGPVRLLFAALFLLLSRPVRTLAALTTALRLSSPGVQSKARHLAYLLQAAWLVRRMAQLRIEHLHAHFGTNPAAVATIARAWGGPPFSFTAHGPDEFDAAMALSLPAKIEAAAFVAGISSFGRAQLMRWSDPRDWGKIKLIRCGLDPAFLDASATPIPEGSTEFICVARLSAQKGLPLLVAACDQLRQRGKSFTVTIVGDGELRETLEQEIRRRELDDHVLLSGIRSSAEIRELLGRARAFVLPSFAEGLPVVLMESLAMSRPVIATEIAGIPELVDDGCGWLIPAGSEFALIEAMEAALHASAEKLAAKGAAGRERVQQMHNAACNSAAILEAIAESARAMPQPSAS